MEPLAIIADRIKDTDKKKFLSLQRGYKKAEENLKTAPRELFYKYLQCRYRAGLKMNKWLESKGITMGVTLN